MKNLITVIIPIYNMENYLQKCLDSVLNQTYKNLEVILIDDGSSDNSLSICNQYANKDNRIKLISKKNEGQGKARNIGLEIATGGFISFIDADDYINLEMYEKMHKYLMDYDCDICICDISVDTGLKVIKKKTYNKIKMFNNEELIKEYIITSNIHAGPCNKLYRADIFTQIKFPNFRAREDFYIMHEILSKARKAVYINEGLYTQYIRENSTEQKKFNVNNLISIKCADVRKKFIKQNYPSLYSYVKYEEVEARVMILKEILCSSSYRVNKKIYKEIKKELSDIVKHINKEDMYSNLKNKDLIKSALEYHAKFFIYCYSLGIKRSVKNIIIKFKNIKNNRKQKVKK